jgi:PAS domain S-box-containing protein
MNEDDRRLVLAELRRLRAAPPVGARRARVGRAADPLPLDHPRLLSILEQIRAVLIETDDRRRVVHVSHTVEQIFGLSPEEIRSGDSLQWLHEDDLPVLRDASLEFLRTGEPTKIILRFRHKSGHWIWMESCTVGWYPSPTGGYHTLTFARDVSDLVRTVQSLRESEERYRLVSESSQDLITETDEEGRITFVGPNVERVLGHSATELAAMRPFDLVHPSDRERVAERLRHAVHSGEAVTIAPFRLGQGDGHWIWLQSRGVTYRRADGGIRFVAVTRDVTERRRQEQERRSLEQRMAQTQKLESLGVMAGGIAHDFNNLLTPILGDASLALMDLPEDSPIRTRLQRIQKAAQRAASLTNQMLSYAGTGPLLVEAVDLTSLVEETGRLLESAVSGRAAMRFELTADTPPVDGDPAQLTQVVMNLITNAADALAGREGRVAIRTGTTLLDREAIDRLLLGDSLPSGSYVYVEVEDDGPGMSEEVRARIFDPFYTTKFAGRGLGLAAVLGIVRRHRGAIHIETAPGSGTRFRVLFPASTRAHTAPAASDDLCDWTAEGEVLVVDDDEAVRELAGEVLRRVSLRPLCAADAREGLDLLERHASGIRAVLLDRTMPGAGGEEMLATLRRLCPHVPVFLMSGYSRERATDPALEETIAGFIKKPFLPKDLLRALRAALEATPTPAER